VDFTLTADLLSAVTRLPKSQRDKVMGVIGEAEFQKCSEDPVYWLDSSQHVATRKWPGGMPYVFTKDPHKIYNCALCTMEVNEEKRGDHLELLHGEEHPSLHRMREVFTLLPAIRPFPMFEFIKPIVSSWLTSQYFAMEKSRDMSATWTLIALHTWDAMFHNGRQEILQSEDAFKTLELVQRANVIYENTPQFLRVAIGPANYSKGTTKSGELYFTKQQSEILGLPQGADQIRQFHPSSIFADEAAFQQEAGATFAAIKPAIMSGGRYSAISSANRSWFERVCRDLTDD
jgi:hypothetical protein